MNQDSQERLADYRGLAAGYDASARFTMPLRRRAVAKLALLPGQAVLDAACGTGLSFPLIEEAIGPGGRLIGVEASPEMLQLTRGRVAAQGWKNITLIEAMLEQAEWPHPIDAVLINYAHDVMRSRKALANIFRQARPGARVVCAGIKHPPRWLDPFRLYRRFKSRGCFASLDGLETPWDLVAGYVPDLRVETTLLGTGYLAWGGYARLE